MADLRIPDGLLRALGPDPDRRATELLCAVLVYRAEISLGYAAEILGLTRHDAMQWYTGLGYTYPNMTVEDLDREIETLRRTRPKRDS